MKTLIHKKNPKIPKKKNLSLLELQAYHCEKLNMPIKFKALLFLACFILSTTLQAGTWKKLYGGAGNSAVTPENTTCPTGYIGVPALPPYTVRYFCVAKYEMKNDGYGTAVSQAALTPWLDMDRPTARSKCQALGAGYDLISNDQWQTIARNIAGVASNWSGGEVASGELSRGHTDNSPANALAAAVDTDPCNGTGQTCSTSTWGSQRRTHTLSNGNVIWDLAGNAWEWVTNDSNVSNGANGYISTMSAGDIRQTRYGAAEGTLCASPSTAPYCGMGYGYVNYAIGTVLRGGCWGPTTNGGVFAAYLNNSTALASASIGFRCVFVP